MQACSQKNQKSRYSLEYVLTLTGKVIYGEGGHEYRKWPGRETEKEDCVALHQPATQWNQILDEFVLN